jgi:hypothetical protein
MRHDMSRCAVICLALLAAVVACSRQSEGTAGTPSPSVESVTGVASSADIMKTMTIPFSDTVFKAASNPPSDDEGWATAREHAAAVAESGNLLLVGGRVRKGTWASLARAQVDAAQEAAKAAADHNAERLSAASDRLYGTCEDCHKVYLQ